MKVKTFKIYTLNCPISKEIRYVGVTVRSLKDRFYQHRHTGKKRRGTAVSKWIYSLQQKGLEPSINLIEECTENNWEEREVYWIDLLKQKNINLLNQHEGGKGVVINRKFSSIDRSARYKYKEVYQCDNDYNAIKLWESAVVASKELGISRASIYKCLEQRENTNPTAGGFKWVKKDLFDSNTFIRKNKTDAIDRVDTVKVLQKDLEGNIIKVFSDKTSLSLYLNIPYHTVNRRLKKGQMQMGLFMYEIAKKI